MSGLTDNEFIAGRFDAERLNDSDTMRTRPLQQSTGLQESPFGPGLPHAGAGNLAVTHEAFSRVGGFDLRSAPWRTRTCAGVSNSAASRWCSGRTP